MIVYRLPQKHCVGGKKKTRITLSITSNSVIFITCQLVALKRVSYSKYIVFPRFFSTIGNKQEI